jgi:integrase/recombinase XerC
MDANKHIGLTEALTLYQEHYLAAHLLAPKTRIEYTNDLEDLLAYLQEQSSIDRPDQIGRQYLQRYLTLLDTRGFRRSTRRRKVATIRSFFSFLDVQGVISKNPACTLIPPLREEDQPHALTEAEEKRLSAVVHFEPRDAAIIHLLLQTGITLSECARLTMDDITLPTKIDCDEDNVGSVTVLGRNQTRRTLPLNRKTGDILAAYLAIGPVVNTPHVFITKFNKGMGKRSIQYLVEKHLREARIKHASVHTLRHTFATRLIRSGAELTVAQRALGHASRKTTAIYKDVAREVRQTTLPDAVPH